MPATRMTTGTGPMITDTGPSGLITASQAAGVTGSPVTALRVGRSRHGLPTYACPYRSWVCGSSYRRFWSSLALRKQSPARIAPSGAVGMRQVVTVTPEAAGLVQHAV